MKKQAGDIMPILPSSFEFSRQGKDAAAYEDSAAQSLWNDLGWIPAPPAGIQPMDFLVCAREANKNIEQTYGSDTLSGLAAKIEWYYETEKSHGANDIKNLKQCRGNPRGENFGNWLAGAVGECLEIPSWMLVAGAGLYQIYSGTSSLSYFDSFFDDPNDTKFIRAGVGWARKSIDRIDKMVRSGESRLMHRSPTAITAILPGKQAPIDHVESFKELHSSMFELL